MGEHFRASEESRRAPRLQPRAHGVRAEAEPRCDALRGHAREPLFDKDLPCARAKSLGWSVDRAVEEPDMVFIAIEFASVGDALECRDRLLRSGVLDRFADEHGPVVVERAEEIVAGRAGSLSRRA